MGLLWFSVLIIGYIIVFWVNKKCKGYLLVYFIVVIVLIVLVGFYLIEIGVIEY